MSMWDIKPGDAVAAVGAPEDFRPEQARGAWPFGDGDIYIVESCVVLGGELGLVIEGFPSPASHRAWHSICFRKVQRRDLSVWLSTENTIEEPKRAPAKERV